MVGSGVVVTNNLAVDITRLDSRNQWGRDVVPGGGIGVASEHHLAMLALSGDAHHFFHHRQHAMTYADAHQ